MGFGSSWVAEMALRGEEDLRSYAKLSMLNPEACSCTDLRST